MLGVRLWEGARAEAHGTVVGVYGLKPCHYPRNASGQEAIAACVWFVPSVCLRFRPAGPFSDSPGRSPGSGAPPKIGV
jgi:hypothetical protein